MNIFGAKVICNGMKICLYFAGATFRRPQVKKVHDGTLFPAIKVIFNSDLNFRLIIDIYI